MQGRLAQIVIRVVVAAAILVALAWLLFDYIALAALSATVLGYPHGSIEIVAFDGDGQRLGPAKFLRRSLPVVVRDRRGIAGFGMPYGLRTARIAVPPGEPVSLEMPWSVPGFGEVMVRADNSGKGYTVERGAVIRIELVPELARSRVAAVEKWVATHGGKATSEGAAMKLARARRLIAHMKPARTSRERSLLGYAALRLGLEAGEGEVLAEARAFIGDHRRGGLAIRVVDHRGKPVTVAKVSVAEVSPNFRFAVFHYSYDEKTLALLEDLGLNYAPLHMNWRQMEPRANDYSFKEFEALFNPQSLKAHGFALRGHALVWFFPSVMPDYMTALRGNPDGLEAKVREHVGAIVRRYDPMVDVWEASNEGHAAWASFGLAHQGMEEVVKASSEELRRLAPGKPILINAALPLGENVPLGYYPMLSHLTSAINEFSTDPYVYFEELARDGVEYDEVGLQFYYGARMTQQFGGGQQPPIDLFRFAEELAHYARLGKPVEVTEVSVGSSHRPDDRWWHAPADQATQADWLEGVFTVCYGNPNVRAVTWWDIYDSDSFIVDGGLIDQSGQPKLAYLRLKSLLNGWRSQGEVVTDHDGKAEFVGAPGMYQVQVRAGDVSATADLANSVPSLFEHPRCTARMHR